MPFLARDLLATVPRLRRYARFLIDDAARADDLVEKTLARAGQARDEPRSGLTPGMALLALLRSVYVDELAPNRRERAPPPMEVRDQEPLASANATISRSPPHTDRLQEILLPLFGLPIEQREVFVLVAVERMSYLEIATLLQVPVATVISRLLQARDALRSSSFEPSRPKSAG